MSSIAIADTGLIVAYLHPRDSHHIWAAQQFDHIHSFVTCEAVLTEASHLAGSAVPILALVELGILRLDYNVEGDEAEIAKLVSKYADVPMDFADACLVRMSERYRSCKIFTVDSDFLVYRRHGRQTIDVVSPYSTP